LANSTAMLAAPWPMARMPMDFFNAIPSYSCKIFSPSGVR
jgi:hypothetical protein